jgi:hypothetical protein
MEAESKKKNELEAIKIAENKLVELSASYVEYLDEDCLFELMFLKDEGLYVYIFRKIFKTFFFLNYFELF